MVANAAKQLSGITSGRTRRFKGKSVDEKPKELSLQTLIAAAKKELVEQPSKLASYMTLVSAPFALVFWIVTHLDYGWWVFGAWTIALGVLTRVSISLSRKRDIFTLAGLCILVSTLTAVLTSLYLATVLSTKTAQLPWLGIVLVSMGYWVHLTWIALITYFGWLTECFFVIQAGLAKLLDHSIQRVPGPGVKNP